MTDKLRFSGVVGLDEAKLALTLAGLQPRLGGVLLRGEKGSAKTTLARGFASLLPEGAPFVELPLGATEERVVGSLDLSALLQDGSVNFRAGLLAAAHGGVLYVDEINLLADHLVDVLLDVAVSGINRVERDGVAHEHPARFVLIGSMNPEEGELRPQLLDRFGLAVDVVAPRAVEDRVEAVRRQLSRDVGGSDDHAAAADDAALSARFAAATPATIDEATIEVASRLALAVGAEGLRADLMLCRAAVALASWEGRAEATEDDLRVVAPMVLAHRRRRGPMDQSGISQDELDDAFDQATSDAEPSAEPEDDFDTADNVAAPKPKKLDGAGNAGRSAVSREGARGRVIGDRAPTTSAFRVAPVASARSMVEARVADPDVSLNQSHLREAIVEERQGALVVVVLDASGSMGAARRVEAAKGLVLTLLTEAYQRRDRVALVTVSGGGAEVVMRPTGSVEVARARLDAVKTGGTTPLADGIAAAADLVDQGRASGLAARVVLITDGRATEPVGDPVAAAQAAAARLVNVPTVIVDAEEASPRLGLAATYAAAAAAELVSLTDLEHQPLRIGLGV